MLANLGVGFTFSTLARSQLQAMQMTYFFLFAFDAAVGVYVSFLRDAGVGAIYRRVLSADAFFAYH